MTEISDIVVIPSNEILSESEMVILNPEWWAALLKEYQNK